MFSAGDKKQIGLVLLNYQNIYLNIIFPAIDIHGNVLSAN